MAGLLKVKIIFNDNDFETIYLVNDIKGVNDLHKKLFDRYSILKENNFRMYWIDSDNDEILLILDDDFFILSEQKVGKIFVRILPKSNKVPESIAIPKAGAYVTEAYSIAATKVSKDIEPPVIAVSKSTHDQLRHSKVNFDNVSQPKIFRETKGLFKKNDNNSYHPENLTEFAQKIHKVDVDPKKIIHPNIICDGCDKEIIGMRYKCALCPDYDLCGECDKKYIHKEHPMIRLSHPIKRDGTTALISQLRNQLNLSSLYPGCCDNTTNSESVILLTKKNPRYLQRHCKNGSDCVLERAYEKERRHLAKLADKEREKEKRYERKCLKQERRDDLNGSKNPRKCKSKKIQEFAEMVNNATIKAIDDGACENAIAACQAAAITSQKIANQVVSAFGLSAKKPTGNEGGFSYAETIQNIGNICTNLFEPLSIDVELKAKDDGTEENVEPKPNLSTSNDTFESVINLNDNDKKPLEDVVLLEDDRDMPICGKPYQPSNQDVERRENSPDKEWTIINSDDNIDDNFEIETVSTENMINEGLNVSSKQKTVIPSENKFVESTVSLSNKTKIDDRLQETNVTTSEKYLIDKPTETTAVPVLDFGQLGRVLKQHIDSIKENSLANLNAANIHTTSIPISLPEPIIYHHVSKINDAVKAMISMGFSNEGGCLGDLLESVDGNISVALDMLQVHK